MPDVKLTELAARYGVSTREDGRPVPESTLRAVLNACGAFEGTDGRPLSGPAAVVTRQSRESAIRLGRAPDGEAVTATLTREDGTTTELDVTRDDADAADGDAADGAAPAGTVCHVPSGQPAGYHRVDVTGADRSTTVRLIVAPDALDLPDRIGRRRHWGYDYVPGALRSDLSWAVGDFADIAEFARLAADQGASFLSTTPLNAPAPATPIDAAPHASSSRQFLNPLLIRVEDIREMAYLPAATRALIDWEAEDQRARNTSAAPMDLDDAWEAKKNALALVFAHPRTPARQAAWQQFVERGGHALDTFSRWCAAAEYFGPDDAKWPDAVRVNAFGNSESGSDTSGSDAFAIDPFDHDNAALEEFRRTSDDRRDFYSWLQWVADEQLRRAAAPIGAGSADPDGADRAGGRIGLVRSTVVSAALAGADAWRYSRYLASGVLAYPPAGPETEQSTSASASGSATLSPGTLRALEFAPVIDAVRAALRHGGGVRLDRPTELFAGRWVPDGADAADGAVVATDADDLLSIVVLEAQRAGAVVMVGDSAGLSVGQRAHLTERGIAVPVTVWDEAAGGELPPADTWPADAVATVTPHGPVPTSAFLSGEHLDSGGSDDGEERRLEHGRLRETVVSGLRGMSFIDSGSTEREILEALYSYVAATPSRYVSVALADAVGDRHPTFAAGNAARHPAARNSDWRMPLADGAGGAVTMARLIVNPRAVDLVGTLADVR